MDILKKGTNEQGNQWVTFHAELVTSPSETVLENSNGKKFKIVTVKYTNAKGESVTSSASIYEGNYSKGDLVLGNSYLTTATRVDKEIYLQMSHLTGAPRPNFEDFDGLFEADKSDSFAPGIKAKDTAKA